jgi:3-deoxy-manno-octulosonate cytidylyltransferase (CMP-KDO synthetase)
MSALATRTVAIIPARYGSTRLPGKPLLEIGGKPMIQHVVERAGQAMLVERVLVATDDQRIVDAVHGFGGEAVMTSPDCRSGTDRIAEVVRSLSGVDIVVNVQGDEPLIPPTMIDAAVKPLWEDPLILVGTLVRRIARSEELNDPAVPKVALDRNGRCLFFTRSPIPHGRDIPQEAWLDHYTYYRHIGIYVFRRSFLLRYALLEQTPLERAEQLEQLRILEHGYSIHAAVTEEESMAVDTPADLERVRRIMESLL